MNLKTKIVLVILALVTLSAIGKACGYIGKVEKVVAQEIDPAVLLQCIPDEGEPDFPDGIVLCVDNLCQAFATYTAPTIPYGWRVTFSNRKYIGLHFQHEDIDWDSLEWIEINWEGEESKRSAFIDITPYVDFCDQIVENSVTSFGTFKSFYR